MGSKSKMNLMKSYKIIKKEAEPKLKNQNRENALDIISKSISNNYKSLVMSTIKNHVQLIGHIGQEPVITNLESGKKVARFSLATNEYYKNAQGEKQTETNWHTIVAWGRVAEIIEKFASKGKEVGVIGKLKSRNYENKEGNQVRAVEVEVSEILLLGSKSENSNEE